MTGLATTILDEAKKLTTDGTEATVGKVLIESDTTEYSVVLKKVSATPADPVIDTANHKITVEVQTTPATPDDITTAIGTIKVGGTVNAPVYEVSGEAVTCSGDFDTATTPVSCTKVTGLPGEDNKQKEEMDKVLKDLKESETVNTQNVDALKEMGADKLKYVSTETIDAFTKTVAQNPIDMSDNLDKVLEIYKNFDDKAEDKVELGSDDVWSSIDTINGYN